MKNPRIEGRWREFKGALLEQWGRLTGDDLDVLAGRRDQQIGRMQQRRGTAGGLEAWGEGRPRPPAAPSDHDDLPRHRR